MLEPEDIRRHVQVLAGGLRDYQKLCALSDLDMLIVLMWILAENRAAQGAPRSVIFRYLSHLLPP